MDPILNLAFTMHANKGAYALLLGSGVSRAASIPTGWEVTLDLVRQLARLEGQECEPDPAAWYVATYNKQPDYSELLDTMAQTPAERNQVLKKYFEPTDEEREQGLKRPTAAHKAVARLMKEGYVRVVITTNFDRLLEDAMAEIGAPPPVVIATADAVEGALPLSHPGSFIIKIHGDYLDMRIKNTVAELTTYDLRLDGLLDRVLDEFGVVTCGWSSDWDIALKSAFERCKGRRFGTYWTHLSPLSDSAQGLVDLRGAKTLQIRGADDFFIQLEEKITSLAEFNRPHPLSIQAAIATVKRYIVDDQQRVRLADLLGQETENLYNQMSVGNFPVSMSGDLAVAVSERIKQYDRLTDMLAAMLVTGTYWAEEQHYRTIRRCLERLAQLDDAGGGNTALLNLRLYPALKLAYACGLAALAAERYDTFYSLFSRTLATRRTHEPAKPLPLNVHYYSVVEYNEHMNPLFDGVRRKAPLADHLARELRPLFKDLIPRDEEFEDLFDKLEYLWALLHVALGEPNPDPWMPVGRLVYLWGSSVERGGVKAVHNEIDNQQANWPLLRAGLFGGALDELQDARRKVDEFFARVARAERYR